MSEQHPSLLENLMQGKSFQLKLSTGAGLTTEKTFTLDDDDYDINGDNTDNTTPFKNMVLFITGYKLLADANTALDYFALDNQVVIDGGKEGYANDQDLYQDGSSRGTGATNYNYPKLSDKHGVPVLPCRNEIAIKASASGGVETLDLYLYGLYMPRVK